MPANSFLFEKQGKIIPFPENVFTNQEELFSSLSCFNGASGQPIFSRKEDQYEFIGILTDVYGTTNIIQTPNHPFARSMQQTGAFFASPKVLEQFISDYLNIKHSKLF